MIRIDKVYEGYYTGQASPPHTHSDYRSGEILSAATLCEELLKRGAEIADIDVAFAEAERHWISPPPRS